MTADEYLINILNREAVNTSPQSPVRDVQSALYPILRRWAGDRLLDVSPSGSFMKGTANRSGTEIDLFILLSEQTPETLREIYDKLFDAMNANGYEPKRLNVSINITVSGFSVDLLPGRRQGKSANDCTLYRRKADTWTKTNVTTHINLVTLSGRQNEIRILKLWRQQKRIEFPSLYLELTVMNALPRQDSETLSDNVWRVFQYLADGFANSRVLDPANASNIVSDDLTSVEKNRIRALASEALAAKNWNEIVR